MHTRRLALLLLPVLVSVPVTARADRHNMECFGVSSTEKKQSLAFRAGCGFRLPALGANLDQDAPSPPGVPQTVPDTGPGHASLSAMTGALSEPTEGKAPPRPGHARALFLFVEAAEYVLGPDSGHSLDGWMIGARYFILGRKEIEPFFTVMAGQQRPARGDGVGDDAPTDWAGTAALGTGVDIELNPTRAYGLVPVLRLQFDLVESWATEGFHPYGRAVFGLSFRWEGRDSNK
jgi:hypothetical protein